MMVKLNGCSFWLKMMTLILFFILFLYYFILFFYLILLFLLLKHLILFGIKSVLILKKCDCEPVYNKTLLKTKIVSCSNEATDFHDKEIPKTGFAYTCLAVTNVDRAVKKDENSYLKVFSKECKYIEKESKRKKK